MSSSIMLSDAILSCDGINIPCEKLQCDRSLGQKLRLISIYKDWLLMPVSLKNNEIAEVYFKPEYHPLNHCKNESENDYDYVQCLGKEEEINLIDEYISEQLAPQHERMCTLEGDFESDIKPLNLCISENLVDDKTCIEYLESIEIDAKNELEDRKDSGLNNNSQGGYNLRTRNPILMSEEGLILKNKEQNYPLHSRSYIKKDGNYLLRKYASVSQEKNSKSKILLSQNKSRKSKMHFPSPWIKGLSCKRIKVVPKGTKLKNNKVKKISMVKHKSDERIKKKAKSQRNGKYLKLRVKPLTKEESNVQKLSRDKDYSIYKGQMKPAKEKWEFVTKVKKVVMTGIKMMDDYNATAGRKKVVCKKVNKSITLKSNSVRMKQECIRDEGEYVFSKQKPSKKILKKHKLKNSSHATKLRQLIQSLEVRLSHKTDALIPSESIFVKRENEYACSVCPYSSRQKPSIVIHARRHTGEKPFRCHFCEYASVESSHLLRHTKMHTGETSHRCAHCDYKCIQKVSIRSHILKRHPLVF